MRVVPDAPWLPAGGRAEVVRSSSAPVPAALVRLLVRRGSELFCTRRDDGRLDLPTRRVPPGDPDGRLTATALAQVVLGAAAEPGPVGFVRNVVPSGDSGYPWPVPLAHFTVWATAGRPVVDGVWLDAADDVLRGRHWWPLVA